jgi:hypothetical protein
MFPLSIWAQSGKASSSTATSAPQVEKRIKTPFTSVFASPTGTPGGKPKRLGVDYPPKHFGTSLDMTVMHCSVVVFGTSLLFSLKSYDLG